MIPRALLGLVACLAAGRMRVSGIDFSQRSESGNKQFVVYSEDVRLRQRVASFAETVKLDVLQLLGESDRWKAPVVITLARATPLDQEDPSARLRVAETQPGFKLEIQVKIGDDPAAVNLHKVILRAVLMEYAYRPTGVNAGQQIVEAPWWIVEGLLGMARQREQGTDAALFRRLVETNRLPPIENFLAEKPDELGPTAMAVDRALAMCLVELLVAQPDGRANLAKLLRDWPQSDGDPTAALTRNFPGLGSGAVLQKWWTLNLARFAVEDRYQGLTAEETEKALAPLLQLELVPGKEGEKKAFPIADFAQYLKIPASRGVLNAKHTEIVELTTRANFVFRPVMAEYEEIFSLLERGKTRGLADRLAKAEEFRQRTLRRTSDIADYLNWFEATQSSSWSGAFDDYLKTAEQLSEQDRKQKGAVGRYLDAMEKEL
jgi:hypothetical protein